ncbi:MAG TPA: hypothetical protein DDE71_04160 [Tenacibaculum sp.]|nr:hypothetical protein [Tenacibaculum sp.]
MAEQDQDKTQPATPFKLKEARNKGQVAKSLELNSLLIMSAFLFVVYLWGDQFIYQELILESYIFEQSASVSFEPARLVNWLGLIMQEVFMIFIPLIAFLVVIAIASNVIQTGFVFSFFPLKPDLKRINPVAGLKRLFSTKLLFEAVKSFIKLGVFSSILYFTLLGLMPELFGLMHMDPVHYPIRILSMTVEVIVKILLGLMIIALLDVLYTRWEYAKQMRMSHRDVKEEAKRREGDPQVRAKIKELQREAAKRSESLKRVPDADVLITNPTHISIALKYKPEQMRAPILLAKGAGNLASKMRKVANKHQIPVIESKLLARTLFKSIGIDEPVRAEHFDQIAEVYAQLYQASESNLSVRSKNVE